MGFFSVSAVDIQQSRSAKGLPHWNGVRGLFLASMWAKPIGVKAYRQLFAKKAADPEIAEWYTVQEIQEKSKRNLAWH